MKRIITSILAIAFLIAAGCSQNEKIHNLFGSELEKTKEVKISHFTLSNKSAEIPDSITEVVVNLSSLSAEIEYAFDAEVVVSAETIILAMFIPVNEVITDSDYILTLWNKDGRAFNWQFEVSISNEMVSGVIESSFFPGLSGLGTEKFPYIIADSTDFVSFLCLLSKDEKRGAGLYFAQSSSFNIGGQGSMEYGAGHIGQEFAGHYDGRHNSLIGMEYWGEAADDDVNIGLFTILHNGASISNLSIVDCSIDSAKENIGLLAGKSEGNVTIDSVYVEGEIFTNSSFSDKMANNVGGFIGCSNSGVVSISGSSFKVRIDGGDNVGGVIGSGSITLKINDLKSSPDFGRITGNSYVGGVIGKLEGVLDISGLTLEHEDALVLSSRSNYLGGVAGYFNVRGKSYLSNVKVKMSVDGDTLSSLYVGGIIGKMETSSGRGEIYLSEIIYGNSLCKVSGYENVGGYFGQTYSTNIGLSGTKDSYQSGNVRGNRNAGGCIGDISNCDITFDRRIEISTVINENVKETYNVGGFAGIIGVSNLNIRDNIDITGTSFVYGLYRVGGFAGYCDNSKIVGKNALVFNNRTVIDTNAISTPAFKGFINYEKPENTYDAGGFIGYAINSTISNLSAAGSVSGSHTLGGLIGFCKNSSVDNCAAMGAKVEGTETIIGGVIGFYYHDSNNIKIGNLFNMTEKVEGCNDVGGVIGKVECNSAYLDYCVNVGGVYGNGGTLGGIVGYTDDGYKEITNSANFGTVTGYGGNGIGGILGNGGADVRISGCTNKGLVQILSGSSYGVGGIAGVVGDNSTGLENYYNHINVSSCCNYGEVHSADGSDSYVGGILGHLNDGGALTDDVKLYDCYNAGYISGVPNMNPGGIVGCIGQNVNVFHCVNTGQLEKSSGNGTCGQPDVAVSIFSIYETYILIGKSVQCSEDTGFTEESGKDKNTFSNLDFNSVWMMGAISPDFIIHNGYPVLKDCYFQTASFVAQP